MDDGGCPNCGAESVDTREAECPYCGIVFAKWAPRSSPAPGRAAPSYLAALFLGTDVVVRMAAVVGRAALWIACIAWTWSFATAPADTAGLESFMHLVNLVFHEAGHVLCVPFGPFMTALGGSVLQLIVPAVCAATLLWQSRDPFGASIACWWFGQNLLDLAPYVGDARALNLVLLGGFTGREVEGHDWEAILGTLGWLEYDRTFALVLHHAGIVVMAATLVWGGAVLRGQWIRHRG